jgi:hypothetical protein
MILLSVGMQKAGTAWYFNITNDLLQAAGHQDIRDLRNRYHLQRFMTERNCNIGKPRLLKLLFISISHWFGKSYVVKTHEGPTKALLGLIDLEMVKATYMYRDPRDVALSAFEHGEKIRRSGAISSTGFDRLTTMESAIEFAYSLLPVWRQWAASGKALLVRYEDMRRNPYREGERLVSHLNIDVPQEVLRSIIEQYEIKNGSTESLPHPLHFNKGITGRWKEMMTEEQVELSRSLFGDHISRMGYEE